jgi:mannose-6-phosphate isomerase-like protein (cupin superfamily)
MVPSFDNDTSRFMDTGDVFRMTKHGPLVSIDVSSADTNGTFVVLTYRMPPHDPGPPVHWHAQTREWWWVLNGTVAVTVGEETLTVAPGTSVFIPPRAIHTFWNPTGAPVALLALLSPGGVERYFEQIDVLSAAEPRTLAETAATFDIWSPASL